MRARSPRATAGVALETAAGETGRPEADAAKSKPQTFTFRLSWVGHQWSVAEAFSRAPSENTAEETPARRWRESESSEACRPDLGKRAK